MTQKISLISSFVSGDGRQMAFLPMITGAWQVHFLLCKHSSGTWDVTQWVTMKTQVQILRTHVKRQAWPHMSVIPAL